MRALWTLLLIPWVAACPGTPGDDGGTTEGCVGQGDPGIAIGQTGVTFEAIDDGDSIPAWQRPQGGIGTRVNGRITGYSPQTDFESLRVEVYGIPGPSPAPGDLGGDCRVVDADAGVIDAGASDGGEELTQCDRPFRCADDDTCQLEVVNVAFNSFPLVCQPDGALLAPEVPVRFKNYLRLPDVSGREVQLSLEITTEAGDVHRGEATVTLEESEFIEPLTFDPLGP